MKSKSLFIIGVVLGVLFLIVGIIYTTHSAESLPSFFPGHTAGMTAKHTKHALAAYFLAIASFIFAWFQAGAKKNS